MNEAWKRVNKMYFYGRFFVYYIGYVSVRQVMLRLINS